MDIEEELLGPVENDAHINDTPATSVAMTMIMMINQKMIFPIVT